MCRCCPRYGACFCHSAHRTTLTWKTAQLPPPPPPAAPAPAPPRSSSAQPQCKAAAACSITATAAPAAAVWSQPQELQPPAAALACSTHAAAGAAAVTAQRPGSVWQTVCPAQRSIHTPEQQQFRPGCQPDPCRATKQHQQHTQFDRHSQKHHCSSCSSTWPAQQEPCGCAEPNAGAGRVRSCRAGGCCLPGRRYHSTTAGQPVLD